MGLAGSAEVESLRRELPQQATLIEAGSAAASGNLTSAIQQLRSIQGANINAVIALAETYLQAATVASAADALRAGGRLLGVPRLPVEAARLLDQNGEHDEAVA